MADFPLAIFRPIASSSLCLEKDHLEAFDSTSGAAASARPPCAVGRADLLIRRRSAFFPVAGARGVPGVGRRLGGRRAPLLEPADTDAAPRGTGTLLASSIDAVTSTLPRIGPALPGQQPRYRFVLECLSVPGLRSSVIALMFQILSRRQLFGPRGAGNRHRDITYPDASDN